MDGPRSDDFLAADRPAPLVRVLPVHDRDACTLYERLAAPGRVSFLLESVKPGQPIARFSFFGAEPYLVLRGRGTRTEVTRDGVSSTEDRPPLAVLAERMRATRYPRMAGFPPFVGGAVGFFGYDLVRRFAALPAYAVEDEPWPDVAFAFVELAAALDHQDGRLYLVFAPPAERLRGEPRDKLYREGMDRLSELEARLLGGAARNVAGEPAAEDEALELVPGQSEDEYVQRVLRCQEYIRAGDIYQANLSHRFHLTPSGRHAGLAQRLYRRLRAVNPSPFAALFDLGDIRIVSSSPERLVRLAGREISTRPIAGTRKRGRNEPDDRRLRDELLASDKERAEHLMLVDLARNDLGRVSEYGSVRVDEFMTVERYSHVSHLVSNVRGRLREGLDAFDLLLAVFPGGTITGVPKLRCMELIETLEPVRRGPYTGSLGYLSWSGDVDLNILIRTMVLTGGRGYLQVGAGIVADSDPAAEYEETMLKAAASIEALRAGPGAGRRSRPCGST